MSLYPLREMGWKFATISIVLYPLALTWRLLRNFGLLIDAVAQYWFSKPKNHRKGAR